MQFVQDKSGRNWPLQLDVTAYRRVLSDLNIDLGLSKYPGRTGQPLTVELMESPASLLGVCWSICRFEAQKTGINQQAFEAEFFGERLPALRAAFFEEWLLFFRSLGQAQDAEAIQNILKFHALVMEKTLQEQQQELGDTSTAKSKATPESPESQIQAL